MTLFSPSPSGRGVKSTEKNIFCISIEPTKSHFCFMNILCLQHGTTFLTKHLNETTGVKLLNLLTALDYISRVIVDGSPYGGG
jgi:hypothetical protein